MISFLFSYLTPHHDADGVEQSLPSWITDVLLGFGNPNNAHYKSQIMKNFANNNPGIKPPEFSTDFIDGSGAPAVFTKTQQVRQSFVVFFFLSSGV